MNLLPSILFWLLCILHGSASSQIIWTEDFSAGGAVIGTLGHLYPGQAGGVWTQTNDVFGLGEGSAANQWYVSGEECGNAPSNCGSVCSNIDASLHVSAIGGLCGIPDCGAAYDATNLSNVTDKRIESPTINTTGYGGLTLSFNYIAAQEDDIVQVSYSCDAGATWTNFPALPSTLCCGIFGGTGSCTGFFNIQGVWTNYSYALPACAENNPSVRIAFHWINDGDGVGTDPSVAIDDIQISSTVILPVQFTSFSGENRDKGHYLSWATASEVNSNRFEIQKSSNAVHFETIAQVAAVGNSSSLRNYSYLYPNPTEGTSFYRLKQIDNDASFIFSDVISLEYYDSRISEIRVFPNPIESSITLEFNARYSGKCDIVITDLSGREIFSTERRLDSGRNAIQMETHDLLQGHYLVSVLFDDQTFTCAIIK